MGPLLAATPVQPLPPTDPRYVAGGTNAQIPDVVGRQADDARVRLEDAGFAVARTTVNNRAVAGTVVGQSPRGSALPDQVVTLQVASGTVPAPPPPPELPWRPGGGGRSPAPDDGTRGGRGG